MGRVAPLRAPARGDPAYWCFLLLGAGTLFPWNALITAADYWEARYPGRHTDRLLTVCYLPANLLVITAMVHWHGRMRPRLRILAGLLGFTFAISAVPLIDLAPATPASLAAVLALVAGVGMCDGLAQGALFGEVALLPPRYTQALVAGTAASGVAVSLLRIATKATLPGSEEGLRRSANLYFALTALVCAACTAVYGWVLPRLPSLRLHRQAALEAALRQEHLAFGGGETAAAAWKLGGAGEAASGLPRPPSLDLELSFEDHLQQPAALAAGVAAGSPHGPQAGPRGSPGLQPDDQAPTEGLLGGGSGSSGSGLGGGAGGAQVRRQPGSAAGTSSWAVLPLVWRLAAANMLIYVVTLSIFPGVLAEDVHSAEMGSWYPVALITAFNLADMTGKSLPSLPTLRLSDARAVLGATLSRVVFVPAFHFAAIGGAGPAVIGLLTACLGLSNGWLTACAMMAGPAAVPPAAAEQAGNLMVLFLILGLSLGAACGFLWLL